MTRREYGRALVKGERQPLYGPPLVKARPKPGPHSIPWRWRATSRSVGTNFNRLEAPYYAPPQVFFESENAQKWPGDVERPHRSGAHLLARSTHREARYLDAT